MMQQIISRTAMWVIKNGRVLHTALTRLNDGAYLVYHRSLTGKAGHFRLRHYPTTEVSAAFGDLRQTLKETLRREVPIGVTGGVTLSHYVVSDHNASKDGYIDFAFRPKRAQGRYDMLVLHPRQGMLHTIENMTLAPHSIFTALRAAAEEVAKVATGNAYLCPRCGHLFVSPHLAPDSCPTETCAATDGFERLARIHLQPMLEQLFFACGAMDDEPDAVQFSISATLAGQDA
jgi:hypothetical protein